MGDRNKNIDNLLQAEPDYERLDHLSVDVWRRIRTAEDSGPQNIVFPAAVRAVAFALSIVACLAFYELSFNAPQADADLFDLRYFSHQSVPSLNLVATGHSQYSGVIR